MWYEELFENYGLKYDQENFAKGTSGECDFIEKEINYEKNTRILDVGCGTGRHSIELAKRGYDVVGIDLSESLLRRAKEKAREQNLQIIFQKNDARMLTFSNTFDLVIMLCEGAFPLMETDEMNFQILQNAANALKPDGKFILTTLNGLFPLFHSIEDFLTADEKGGKSRSAHHSFDLLSFRDYNTIFVEDDSGNKKEIQCNERYYVPSEINWLLQSLNFNMIDIFGAKLGDFSRGDELSTNDFEMLIVAEKQ